MNDFRITEDTVVAHMICERKSYLMLFQYSEGKEQPYAALVREHKADNESRFFRSKSDYLEYSSDKLSGKGKYILDSNFIAGNVSVSNVHLEKKESSSKLGDYSYEPLIFSDSIRVSAADRLKASYIGYVLNKIQDKKPEHAGVILTDGRRKNIKLNKGDHLPILSKLNEWMKCDPVAPSISFTKHCSVCQFESQCLAAAEIDDSISLLSNMPATIRKKYESKGIFTIKQLSYLYKPRRRSKKWGERKPIHQYELQALALRTNNIYTSELLKVETEDVEIYVDIESVPDQQFHYLIGVLVSFPRDQKFFSFWANNAKEQKDIWESFLNIANKHMPAPIYHYGSYEKKVITELSNRYKTNVDSIISRLRNVNSYIYGRIYFPSRSNRLKDICNYLGLSWTAEDPSGLNSVVWRNNFDKTNDHAFRDDLIAYNKEDCINLRKLKSVVAAICSNEAIMPGVKAANDKDQLLSGAGKHLIDEFSNLIKSAHGKYEKSKISLKKKRSSDTDVDKNRTNRPRKIANSKIDKTIRVARGRVCPVHRRPLLKTSLVGEVIITDLVCGPRGIKSVHTKYWGYKGRCPNCSGRYNPPGLKVFGKNAKYGRGLKAWIAYHRLTMRLPFRKITQLLEDSFNITIASGGIDRLFKAICDEYRATEKVILQTMMHSQRIHVDETLVNIQGRTQYVWVFTDGDHVIFRLTPTRDSSIAHQVLDEYNGVVISDFFAGYDALECPQQKCWVHLIRDINDDMRKSPFDTEFENFVLSLRDLLIPIFNAVEKYGLKKRNLNKFRRSVERFYQISIDGQQYESDITKKYVKRLSRYRGSLFVFLEHDSIPWNNNMAERALRHLAVQRKISGSFFASGMTKYLLLLGVMQTCRFQNKPFLEFLMSGDKDINRFKGKKNNIGWSMR